MCDRKWWYARKRMIKRAAADYKAAKAALPPPTLWGGLNAVRCIKG